MEFAAWAKSAAEKRELATIHQELAQLRADLNELREEQRRQAWASRMDSLRRRNEGRTVERDSESSVATIGLLSLGAMALIVHGARDRNDTAASVRGGDASHTKSEEPDPASESGDFAPTDSDEDGEEKRLLEKIRAQTATPEELQALVGFLWRRRPPAHRL